MTLDIEDLIEEHNGLAYASDSAIEQVAQMSSALPAGQARAVLAAADAAALDVGSDMDADQDEADAAAVAAAEKVASQHKPGTRQRDRQTDSRRGQSEKRRQAVHQSAADIIRNPRVVRVKSSGRPGDVGHWIKTGRSKARHDDGLRLWAKIKDIASAAAEHPPGWADGRTTPPPPAARPAANMQPAPSLLSTHHT